MIVFFGVHEGRMKKGVVVVVVGGGSGVKQRGCSCCGGEGAKSWWSKTRGGGGRKALKSCYEVHDFFFVDHSITTTTFLNDVTLPFLPMHYLSSNSNRQQTKNNTNLPPTTIKQSIMEMTWFSNIDGAVTHNNRSHQPPVFIFGFANSMVEDLQGTIRQGMRSRSGSEDERGVIMGGIGSTSVMRVPEADRPNNTTTTTMVMMGGFGLGNKH